jgi:hypothetical protein
VIEGQFEYPIGAKAAGFSHGDLSLGVQVLHDPTGNQLLSPEGREKVSGGKRCQEPVKKSTLGMLFTA